MITDDMVKEICDRVENSLENYVLEYRGRLFDDGKIIEGGMEEQIRNQYESRLSDKFLAKGEDIKLVSEKQKEYIKIRIKNTLELSKRQYES